jgi:heat shock protein HslJ
MRDKMQTRLTLTGDITVTASCAHLFRHRGLVMISALMLVLAGCNSKPQQSQRPLSVNDTQPVKPPQLIETRWKIDQLGASKMQSFTELPMLVFAIKKQQVWGSTGCNRLTGSYVLGTTTALTIRANISRLNCEGALAQEAKLLDALDQTRLYQLSGQTLRLLDRNHQMVVLAHAD